MRFHNPEERSQALSIAEDLDLRHLDLGTSSILEHVIRARFELMQNIREFLTSGGYIEHVAPHIVTRAGACESHDRVFPFEYYGQEAFLVQSCQLYQECLLPRFERVFCFTQSFRNEKYFKYNHLTESTLLESMSRNSSLDDELDFIEKIMKHISTSILQRRSKAFDFFGYENAAKLSEPFKRITYHQALKLCGKDGGDFSTEDDEAITSKIGCPVFITNFPASMKFFTTKRVGNLTLSADLLLHESGEVMGVTETEKDPSILEMQFDESPFSDSKDSYEWYLSLHRNVEFSQSGFGMGVERLLKYLCGLPSITLATPFPRYKGHLNP